jgi:hypothetical protein
VARDLCTTRAVELSWSECVTYKLPYIDLLVIAHASSSAVLLWTCSRAFTIILAVVFIIVAASFAPQLCFNTFELHRVLIELSA